MSKTILSILMIIIGLFLGLSLSVLINFIRVSNAAKKIDELKEKAKKEAEKFKRDLLFEAKEEKQRLKNELDKEIKEKKSEIKDQEDRLIQREKNMDKRDETFQKREQLLDEREGKLEDKQKKIQSDQEEMDRLKQEQIDLLSKISGLDKDKAKDLIMKKVEEEISNEIVSYIKEREDEAKLISDKKSSN